MNYKIVKFPNTNGASEILIAVLDSINFDSFEENENELIAYIKEEDLNLSELKAVLTSMEILENLEYEISDLENKNWNDEWEKSFQPITIDGECTIRASFHKQFDTKYVIEIEPKMAFGTGHHATTDMMISFMLKLDFNNKDVLDFGCGTGILSVLAEKMGAKYIFANDVEEPAYENVEVNATLNNCTKISNNLGDISIVPNEKYDIILANVNTHQLSENLHFLKEKMKPNGIILLSGILIEQVEIINKITTDLGMKLIETKQKDKWTALKLILES